MSEESQTLESLPGDIILTFMRIFDIDTILSLVSASPVAYRLFNENRAYVYKVQLGQKYIKYQVPAPLVEALHLAYGLEVSDPNSWAADAEFPWQTGKGQMNGLVGVLGRVEYYHGWGDVVAACYVEDDEFKLQERGESSEGHALHQGGPIEDAIAQLLSTKSLAWMKIGEELVNDMELVAEKFNLTLGPTPLNPDQPPWDVYPIRGYKPISHLQIWVHEFRCHTKDSVRKHLYSTFVLKAGLKCDWYQKLFALPYRALEAEANPFNVCLAAHANIPLSDPHRERQLIRLARAQPADKIIYDRTLWTSGSGIIARLCRMTDRELKAFHLDEFNKYLDDPDSLF